MIIPWKACPIQPDFQACWVQRSFWGWKLDGKEDKGNPSQSSTLNPLGRYSRPLQISTLPTLRNLRFFIFSKHLASSCNFIGSGKTSIMPQMLSDP